MTQPNLQTRREFLRTGLVGGALTWTIPGFLHSTLENLFAATDGALVQPVTGKDGPILVVLQLAGGNDGLNTIIPIGNDHYYRSRPSLGVPKNDILRLDDETGLHPSLQGLKEVYDQGWVSIVQGVGYPNPNRSHFRSMEIWQTASDENRTERHGWIGRYFDNYCQGCDSTAGIAIGSETPQAFTATIPKAITFENPNQYRFRAPANVIAEHLSEEERMYREMSSESALVGQLASGSSIGGLGGAGDFRSELAPLDFLERVDLDAQVSSEQIQRLAARDSNRAEYPNSSLARELSLVARLIEGGMSTRIYYLSLGGFDTHTQQTGTHARLLGQLGDALKAFLSDLDRQGNRERVAVLTFSEFGRRVAQNGSGGTDHGAAAPLLLAGGKTRGGILFRQPSLNPADLDQGDLKHQVDFRSVYATVLEKHLGVNSRPVLGREFPLLKALT